MAACAVGGTYLLPANPPIEASPAKRNLAPSEPLTNGGRVPSPSHSTRSKKCVPNPLVERRHRGDLSWNYLPVSLSSDEEDFRTFVLPLVRPDWNSATLRRRVFEDGVTNKMVGFFRDGAPDETAVLVRVNGEGRELVVDGETEILVMLTLHRAGLSPPLYLVTENALCYGYIPGRTLTGSEMQGEDVLDATSKALALFHSVPPPSCLRGRGPWVWSQLERWMELVSSCFTEDSAPQRFRQVFGTVEEVRQEMEWLKSFLRYPSVKRVDECAGSSGDGLLHTTTGSGASQSLCVLCHNDPQPLNFVRTPAGGVMLIDMEYSSVNCPAFDIGTFFCEFAGVHGTVDYSRYPSEAVQRKWISNYLHEFSRINGLDPLTVTPAQIDRVFRDANHYALVAHFLWSLWSIIQMTHSKLHFDYFEYGCSRYREYKRKKSIILSQQ